MSRCAQGDRLTKTPLASRLARGGRLTKIPYPLSPIEVECSPIPLKHLALLGLVIVVQKVADEVELRRFQGEGVEFF